MLIYIAAIILMVIAGAWCLIRIQREYRQKQTLSIPSVVGVWLLYSFHLGVTILAAIMMIWPLPLKPLIGWTAGTLLLISGTALYAAGIWSFQSFKRMSGLDNSKLVTTGIYRWSRNPQNVGWAMCLLGIALLSQSAMAVLLVALFWVLFVFYVRMEEKYLESIFGQQYRDYMQWSHRYFGPPRNA